MHKEFRSCIKSTLNVLTYSHIHVRMPECIFWRIRFNWISTRKCDAKGLGDEKYEFGTCMKNEKLWNLLCFPTSSPPPLHKWWKSHFHPQSFLNVKVYAKNAEFMFWVLDDAYGAWWRLPHNIFFPFAPFLFVYSFNGT